MARLQAQDPWVLPDPTLLPVSDGGRFLPIIGRIDHFAGRWQRLKAQSPEQIEQLRMTAMIESVASSTRIEGARLSNEQVSDVLAGIQIDSFHARDEQEVRGYRDLLELIRTQYETMALTESSLKEFHRILLAHSEKDAFHRGDYKQTPNHVEKAGDGPPVVVFRTAPPAETRWWMERLVAEFNSGWNHSREWHRLLLIADFILWFLAIHPFQDGNGRLARAVTTLLQLKAGYAYVPYASLERIVEERKVGYYIALQKSQVAARRDTRDYADWLTFFLDALEAQQQVLEDRLIAVARRGSLPALRAQIVDLITEHGPMTTPQLSVSLGASQRTIRYHLARLTREKLLEAPARTAGRRYSLPLSQHPLSSALAAAGAAVVSGSAGLGSDSAEMLTPLDFAPALQQQVNSSPNGRAYATVVVVGATSSGRSPLGDRELDAFETFARALSPTAMPLRATPDVAWWSIADSPRLDKFQIWLYQGPLVQVHWALDASDAPDDGFVGLNPIGLVVYWRHVLRSASVLAKDLQLGSCVVGLNLQTLPAGRPYIVDLDFATLPRPTRSGNPESVPPWTAARIRVEPDRLADDDVLRPALDQLLRHYSYRHTDATIDAALALAGTPWDPDSVPTRLLGRRGIAQQVGTLA